MSPRMRRLAALGGLVIVASAVVVARAARSRGSHRASAVATREDVSLDVDATGRLASRVFAEIGPPSVEGFWDYDLQWMIPEGSRVKAGDVVARFDASEIEERLRDAQAARETAVQEREKEERSLQMRIHELELDLVKAQGEAKQLDVELDVPEGLLSSVDIEQKKLARDLARKREAFLAEKIAFERRLVQSKLELLDVKKQEAETRIAHGEESRDKFTVKSPIPGLVVRVPKGRDGAPWEVGESVWMLAKILKVGDTSTLQIEASLLEADAARVAAGQSADVSIDALPGVVLHATVADVGQVIRERSFQDHAKVVDVVLPIAAADLEQLKPGMGAHVTIHSRVLPGSIVVPIEAIVTTPDGTFVDVLGDGGSTERRAVALGERSGARVVVRQGLKEGERVALPRAGAA